jgi:hypothetical protein
VLGERSKTAEVALSCLSHSQAKPCWPRHARGGITLCRRGRSQPSILSLQVDDFGDSVFLITTPPSVFLAQSSNKALCLLRQGDLLLLHAVQSLCSPTGFGSVKEWPKSHSDHGRQDGEHHREDQGVRCSCRSNVSSNLTLAPGSRPRWPELKVRAWSLSWTAWSGADRIAENKATGSSSINLVTLEG